MEARRLYEEAERLSGSAAYTSPPGVRGWLIVVDIYQTVTYQAVCRGCRNSPRPAPRSGTGNCPTTAWRGRPGSFCTPDRAHARWRSSGELVDHSVALEGVGHNLLAWAIHAGGDSDAALASLEARVRGNVGPFDASIARSVQGRIYYDLGRLDEAEKALKASIDLLRPMGEVPMFQAVILERLGSVYADQGDPVRAREALEATLPLFEKLGAAPSVRRVRAEISGLEQPGVTRETPSRTAR